MIPSTVKLLLMICKNRLYDIIFNGVGTTDLKYTKQIQSNRNFNSALFDND